MPPRKKPAGPKDLCLYLLEVDENGGVPQEYMKLIRHCIKDKLFSENPDHIAINRTDQTSSVAFGPVNWDAMRKMESKCRQVRVPLEEQPTNGISVLIEMCRCIFKESKEDSYENNKLLFFGLLKEGKINEKSFQELAAAVKKNKIHLSLILPDEPDMDATQLGNMRVLKQVLDHFDHGDFMYMCSVTEAKKQIWNTYSKPSKRAMPWNAEFEMGPDLTISVSGYVCTRKNISSEFKKVLVKDEKNPVSGSSLALIPAQNSGQQNKTAAFGLAKNLTAKEVVWRDSNGQLVSEDDVGKAYYYGNRLVSFNELEEDTGGLYKSGEKCLKLLVFCPKDRIVPGFQLGDGTTLFYPRKGDICAALKFDALLKVLHSTQRVAIVKKVYRKGTRTILGVLYPDLDRKCLVFLELCFADDVSIPQFGPLTKKTTENIPNVRTKSRKDQLVSDLINTMSLDGFHPFEGPVDPTTANMRTFMTAKILDPSYSPANNLEDNIDAHFDKLLDADELFEEIKITFPLIAIKGQSDRPSGAIVFKKRQADEDLEDIDEGKKLKIEQSEAIKEDAVKAEEKMDYDELLDDI